MQLPRASGLQDAKAYASRVIPSLMTFMEPLPVGLVMTLISAVVLRRKEKAAPEGKAAVA